MSKTYKNKGTLEDLISSGRREDIHNQKYSYEIYQEGRDHSLEDQLHQQSVLEFNEDDNLQSHNNHTQSADSPSQIEFSQSFTVSTYTKKGTQSMRAHSPIQKTSSIQVDKLKKKILQQDNQINQLTNFLNLKRKQQGNFNSIYNEQINKLQEDLIKKDIINAELNKQLASSKQELQKYQKINDENYDQFLQYNQNVLIYQSYKKQTGDLVDQLNLALQNRENQNTKLKDQNSKLKESNRKMAEILGENVAEIRVGAGSRISRDVSPRNSAVMINNNANTAALKQRQQLMKVQQELSTVVAKYEQLKKKNSQRDKASIEHKQQIMKLENNLQSKQKVIESLNKQLGDKSQQLRNIKDRSQKMNEIQKKLQNQKLDSQKKDTKISTQTNQLADKNIKILNLVKNESELKSKLEMEVNRTKQNNKQIRVLNQKIEANKETIKKLEKQIESLKDNQINTKKEQCYIKEIQKKQEEVRLQTQKSLDKYKKQLSEKESLITQLKKKIEELQKKQQQVIKSNASAREEEIQQLKKEITVEKQKSKKQSIEMTKKQSELQRLQNKIMILEARVSKTSYVNQASVNQELQDRIQSLEIIIDKRNETIKQLERQLERHRSNQIQKQISHDLVNYNLKEIRGTCEINEGDISTNSIVSHLKEELEQKYQMIRLLKNDNQKKDKSIEFAMQKFLKAQQEKLMMEQNIGRETIYSALQDSTEQDCNGRNTEEDREYDILLSRCQMLEERNKSLQVKVKQLQQFGRYRSAPSSQFSKTSYNMKVQNTKLKNQNQELRDQIHNLLNQNKRKSNIEKLTSDQLVQLLIDVLKKIYKSSQLIKIVVRNPQFLDLVRKITRREQKNSQPILVSKRSY